MRFLSVLFLFLSLSSQACLVRVYSPDGDDFEASIILESAGFGTEVGKWGNFHFMADLREPEKVVFTVSKGSDFRKGHTVWREDKRARTFLLWQPFVFQLSCERE